MSIWGKVFGGMTGFALGGPLGGLIGALAGHAVDRFRNEGEAAVLGAAQAAKRMAFSVAVVVLGAKLAKVDGAVNRAEVAAFKEVFRIPPGEMGNVGRIFNVAKRDPSGYERYARQVAWMFRNEPALLEELLAGLFHIARADGEVGAAELAFLCRVADIFGLSAQAFQRVRAGFIANSANDPYEVLGIARDAPDEDIKRAYRRLIRENHPDILVAKGMPQEFIQVANERMAAINAAYDQLEKRRGLR